MVNYGNYNVQIDLTKEIRLKLLNWVDAAIEWLKPYI